LYAQIACCGLREPLRFPGDRSYRGLATFKALQRLLGCPAKHLHVLNDRRGISVLIGLLHIGNDFEGEFWHIGCDLEREARTLREVFSNRGALLVGSLLCESGRDKDGCGHEG
jgi:hypothetical protein